MKNYLMNCQPTRSSLMNGEFIAVLSQIILLKTILSPGDDCMRQSLSTPTSTGFSAMQQTNRRTSVRRPSDIRRTSVCRTSTGRTSGGRPTSSGRPPDVRRTSAERPPDVCRTSAGRLSDVRRTSVGRQSHSDRMNANHAHADRQNCIGPQKKKGSK